MLILAVDFKDVNKQLGYKYLTIKDECEELKEQLQANQPTGICETCTATTLLQNDNYRKALKRIKYEATEEMKDLEADTNAYGCFMEILNIINKVKEKE